LRPGRTEGCSTVTTRGSASCHLAAPIPRLRVDEGRCLFPTSPFAALVREAARKAGVEPRALAVRALLHLPRVASCNGWVSGSQLQRELKTSAEELRVDVRAAATHVPVEEFPLRDLSFEEIDSSRALPIFTSLHYLRSARPDSKVRYFALVDPIGRLPVSLCSISPLQWKRVGSRISAHFDIPEERVWDITRVYSVDSAPRNAVSLLLSKVRTFVRRTMADVDLLLTAVDPNLGFTGSSYRAANWHQWMTVSARPYLYENGRYVTPRQLRERFGAARFDELQKIYPGRFEKSRVRLLDSMIYCSSINEPTRSVPDHDRPRLRR
jgi:hypothetical protein